MENDNLRLILATNLRKLRESKGLSQEELGSRAGLHRTYVGAVERAERNITLLTLQRFAQALAVDPVTLLVADQDSPQHG